MNYKGVFIIIVITLGTIFSFFPIFNKFHEQIIIKKKINPGIILIWTKVFQWRSTNGKIICGSYECLITTNKSMVSRSNLVVFNARYAKGNTLFLYIEIGSIKKNPYKVSYYYCTTHLYIHKKIKFGFY